MPSVSHPHNPHLTSQHAARLHTLYIGGHWASGNGAPLSSFNPADDSLLWEGKTANADDVHKAVMAARAAFPAWSRTSYEERLAVLEKFRALLEQHKAELAEVISRETGKVLWDANGEVAAMIGKIAISAKAYQERTGERVSDLPDGKAVLRHRPHGVVAVFGPYNFPGHLPNGHIVPALLAGNTVVFKPSEMTPLVAERTVQLWHEAGIPAGVLNLVQGEKETGIALANHAELDGLFFTGSSATGNILHKQFAGRPEKILALEMGGNNALIVHGAKDLKAAAYITIQSAYISSGQRCTCARRLIVPTGKEGDEFLNVLAEMVKKIRVGAWNDKPEPFMGPLVSLVESEKLVAAEEALVQVGAKAIVPMQRVREGLPFLSPGLLDVTAVKDRADREFFGPLLQVIRVVNMDAAIHEANHTAFGLSGGIITDDRKLYERCAVELRCGVLNWNRPLTGASSAAPFGGIGCSGNHRPSAYYAADYCAYPVATMETESVQLPSVISPGLDV